MIDDIYQRRAERLAKPLAADDGVARVPVLAFRLGEGQFAVEIAALAEVFPYRGCTPVTGGPTALIGVLNVRGDIRPVVDLARLLDVAPADVARGYVLMARHRVRHVAFRVDGLGDVRRIEASRLSCAEGTRPSRLVKALIEGTVRVVDMNAVFAALGIASE